MHGFEQLEDRRLLTVSFSEFMDPNPNPGNEFGHSVVPLSTGNVVITSPFDDAGATNAGAVYLFNGQTGALISTLIGSSSNDNIGIDGVLELTNGNFVIQSSDWDNGGIADAGAVTWGNGTSGIAGVISSSNSLVGSANYDRVGSYGVTTLINGNYVVCSSEWDDGIVINAGAVTWGDGITGISGIVSSSNSLVGSTNNDFVGSTGVTALSNGNYIVGSAQWSNGSLLNAGAVTWSSGASGISGIISVTNSLVGSSAEDSVGSGGVTELSNSNYVIGSRSWDNGNASNAGAVTWASGDTGVSGEINSSNSLVGSSAYDRVGSYNSVTILRNGNFVVRSVLWDNGSVADAGAVTWGDGVNGISGILSSSNSLIGTTNNDQVGFDGVTALTNGNYVVISSRWDHGIIVDAGAVTLGTGSTGISGTISSSNSLVGSSNNDLVGSEGVTSLTNGNYVIGSIFWNNGNIVNAGAATWGSGTTGVVGSIDENNSLIGSSENDRVGESITSLSRGNYVVGSRFWDNGNTSYNAGAATWGNGSIGITGTIDSSNSLIGSSAGDFTGESIIPLSNGNYLVHSFYWNDGSIVNAGAVTWGSGASGISGLVNIDNSLVGNSFVGFHGITALTNGNYVVRSSEWSDDSSHFGAVTWGNGTTGTSGPINSSNSLVGSTLYDFIGFGGLKALPNGNYVVRVDGWDNGTIVNTGAVTWGNGAIGTFGEITVSNSHIGGVEHAGLQPIVIDNVNGTYYSRFLYDGSGRVIVGDQGTDIALDYYFQDSAMLFDMAVVTLPTATQSDGSVTEVPDSVGMVHEWQGTYLEVYAKLPVEIPEQLTEVHFTLNYDESLVQLDFNSSDTGLGLDALSIIPSTNQLEFSASISALNLGQSSPFLIARIPVTSSVIANLSGEYPSVENLALPIMIDSYARLDQIPVDMPGANAATPSTKIKAVRYDINDNDRVDLSDLVMVIQSFGTMTSNDPLAFRADFDEDGTVGLSDLVRVVQHFGYEKGKGQTISFPTIVEPEGLLLDGSPAVEESVFELFEVVSEPETKVDHTLPLQTESLPKQVDTESKNTKQQDAVFEQNWVHLSPEFTKVSDEEALILATSVQTDEHELKAEDYAERLDDLFAEWD